MSNLQLNCCLKFDFQKVDQHAGGKWLIHDTKRHKDNQLQSLKLPCRISLTWFNFNPSMDLSKSIHYKVWDEITLKIPLDREVWERISNFISHFTWHVISYPCWV